MGDAIKRLAACFDGTETTGSGEQRRFYDEGVGTRWGERLSGGAFGIGPDRNIRQGYAWLGLQFALAEGDVQVLPSSDLLAQHGRQCRNDLKPHLRGKVVLRQVAGRVQVIHYYGP